MIDDLQSIELARESEMMRNILKGTKGNINSKVMIIGEAYGANEDIKGLPFVGASGEELSKMLREAKIDPDEVFYTNVINKRPMGNNFAHFLIPNVYARRERLTPYRGVYPSIELMSHIRQLEEVIDIVNPEIIIAVGNWPMWLLYDGDPPVKTDKGYKVAVGVAARRGSMYVTREIKGKKYNFLPTYHPAGILRQWSWRHIAVQDFRRVKDFLDGKLPWHDTRKFNWTIQPTANFVEEWVVNFLDQKGKTLSLVLDLETFASKIHIVGVRSLYGCMCIPFMHVTKYGTSPVYSKEDFLRIARSLRRLLSDPRVELVGQNLVYDLQYLERWLHVRPKIGFDDMIAQHILFVDDRKGLDYLASLYCRFYEYWKDERKVSLASESTEEACEYNCKDLEYTYEVWRVQEKLLAHQNLEHLMSDKLELAHILIKMMRRGVRINLEEKASMGLELMEKSDIVIQWLEKAMPNHLKEGFKPKTAPWYNSSMKLNEILYNRLKLRAVISRQSGNFTTGKEALTTLITRYPYLKPLFNMIAILRSLGVFYSTFVQAKLDNDDRMRCEYSVTGTITNRLASSINVFNSGMNLMNIPRERNPITMYNATEELV